MDPYRFAFDLGRHQHDGFASRRPGSRLARCPAQSRILQGQLLTGKAGSKEVDEKELVAAIEHHGLLFLQKPVTALIVASQFSAAFANR